MFKDISSQLGISGIISDLSCSTGYLGIGLLVAGIVLMIVGALTNKVVIVVGAIVLVIGIIVMAVLFGYITDPIGTLPLVS
jgi:hypothetical protein